MIICGGDCWLGKSTCNDDCWLIGVPNLDLLLLVNNIKSLKQCLNAHWMDFNAWSWKITHWQQVVSTWSRHPIKKNTLWGSCRNIRLNLTNYYSRSPKTRMHQLWWETLPVTLTSGEESSEPQPSTWSRNQLTITFGDSGISTHRKESIVKCGALQRQNGWSANSGPFEMPSVLEWLGFDGHRWQTRNWFE